MTTARSQEIAALLCDGLKRHGVAGAALAIAVDGELTEYAAGVADCVTGEAMRPDTLCLVGSTTKVYTATLIMQLVEQGQVVLDDRVIDYLPSFSIADPDATADLTVRHLLSHTSGLGVGPYDRHSWCDDAVQRYVESLNGLRPVHPPGEYWGYSNAAYVVAGRIVEVLTGMTWDNALRENVLVPGALSLSYTMPDELLLQRVAKPHIRTPGHELEVGSRWGLSRPAGPTGGTLATSAGDLVRFAQIHLAGGLGSTGRRVLGSEAVIAMQERQAAVPQGWPYGDEWCVGWFSGTWGRQRMIGHVGHNGGSGSQLAVLPDAGGAMALVFNSVPGDATLAHELFAQLASELFGAAKPAPWLPKAAHPLSDLGPLAGEYSNDLGRVHVEVSDDALLVTADLANQPAPPEPVRYLPITATAYGSGTLSAHAALPPSGFLTPELFFAGFDPVGRPALLYRSVFPFRRTDP